MMVRVLRRFAVLLALALGASAAAQEVAEDAQILTINQDRLFAETTYGFRVASELEDEARALAQENRMIESQLVAEERQLTEQRNAMPVDQFRDLAQAFDEKVQRIRAEQDAKSRELQARRDAGRQEFLLQIVPILSDIVRERGAYVILDRRDVFLSADSVDITDEAIRRINEAIGDGSLGDNGDQ